MLVNFINPMGIQNSADLSEEGVLILKKTEGYEVLTDCFNDESPAVAPRLNIIKAGENSTCISCEG